MKIAIIGAGNVGVTLGRAWASRDHEVCFGVRDPDDAKHDSLKSQTSIAVCLNEGAAQFGDVVALATPWATTESAVKSCGDLSGKTVIDCTNPLSADFSGLAIGHTSSGAETIARWAEGANVVKAMNQIGYSLMDDPQLTYGKPCMFLCGNNESAKATVIELVDELGFETFDAGDLSSARMVEPLAMLWIHLALKRGMGTDFGFGILRRKEDER